MSVKQVNNELYQHRGHAWWDDNVGEFSSIRFFVNPTRFAYFKRILSQHHALGDTCPSLLDVGCGGGLLAEEFSRAGCKVTGVDPATESIDTATRHAAASSLAINYQTCSGEHLPFADAVFDLVSCCDVLEHVDNVDAVVSEIARVLKPEGLFLFDTINRTFMSNLAVIKVMQEWPSTAFAEPNMHVWQKFIKPQELCEVLNSHALQTQQLRGISPRNNFLANWLDFRRRATGHLSFKELGKRLAFHESDDLAISYMGYAHKPMLSI